MIIPAPSSRMKAIQKTDSGSVLKKAFARSAPINAPYNERSVNNEMRASTPHITIHLVLLINLPRFILLFLFTWRIPGLGKCRDFLKKIPKGGKANNHTVEKQQFDIFILSMFQIVQNKWYFYITFQTFNIMFY